MTRLDPKDRPALQADALIRILAEFEVNWVLCGSFVLQLHGAKLSPNDLDVVPDLAPGNLQRLADCLSHLNAVAAYLDGWGGPRGTYASCRNWRPWPVTPTQLDWLYVTQFGMLDIVIEKADPYEVLMSDATQHAIDGTEFWMCDPRRVLKALAPRNRQKDAARLAEYDRLRRKFGMT